MKDVHDHVRVIDDDPLAERVAIDGVRLEAVIFFQPFLDFTRDGLEVRLGSAGADHEKIGEARDPAQIERDGARGFFIVGKNGAEGGKLVGGYDVGSW